jgi:hypothetical protein
VTPLATDWVTISALATAAGTLVLAAATFASVRSANRAARAAERSLLAGLRPVLMPSRLDDPPQKVGFADDKYLLTKGGYGAAEATDDVVYLAMSIRNAGAGIAVLDGWYLYPERRTGADEHPPPIEDFQRLTRDIYVPAGDMGFWQGVFRDPSAPGFAEAAESVREHRPMTVDVLYGDHEGGQRTITRFGFMPREDGGWLLAGARHWNVDRDDPR